MYDDFKNNILHGWPMNQALNKVELKRKEYAARTVLDEREIALCQRRGQLKEVRDHALQQLVLTLRASIYGKDHPKKHVIRYPETWWDAVKERFAPTWFRERYPVRFVEVTASLEELYPEFEPSIPDMLPVVKLHVSKEVSKKATKPDVGNHLQK